MDTPVDTSEVFSFELPENYESKGGVWDWRIEITPQGRKVLRVHNELFLSNCSEWREDAYEAFKEKGCKVINYSGDITDYGDEFFDIIDRDLIKFGIDPDSIIKVFDFTVPYEFFELP